MTLTDLYNRLDWDRADRADGAFVKARRQTTEEIALSESMRKASRCNIIFGALYEKNTERQNFCIQALKGVGVWQQIIDILTREGLCPAKHQEQAPEHPGAPTSDTKTKSSESSKMNGY